MQGNPGDSDPARNGHPEGGPDTTALEPERDKRASTLLFRFAPVIPPVIYLICVIILGTAAPGLQYDEAIFDAGAVHIIHGKGTPPFSVQEASWVNVGGRYPPLAVLPYAGSFKDYLLVLPFLAFGATVAVVRWVNALMTAAGLLGMTLLVRNQLGLRPALVTGCLVALHPGLTTWTLYDNSALAGWTLCMGILSVALDFFLRHRTWTAAFFLGVAGGLAVWERANFAWLFIAVAGSLAIVLGKRLAGLVRHLPAFSLGAIAGGSPFLAYQYLSRGSIFRFMARNPEETPLGALVAARLTVVRDMIIYDSDRRGLWDGPALPAWQSWLFPALLLASLAICLSAPARGQTSTAVWRRVAALTFILAISLTITSRLPVAAHHLVIYLHAGALTVALAAETLLRRPAAVRRGALLLLMSVYAATTLYWTVQTGRALRTTGGKGHWSSAIYRLADELLSRAPERKIFVLDWGYSANLYFLSLGKLELIDLFWGGDDLRTPRGETWRERVEHGDLFLLPPRDLALFPDSARRFAAALKATGLRHSTNAYRQGNGAPFAYLVDVAPRYPVELEPRPLAARMRFRAVPAKLQVCDGSGLGVVELRWNVNDAEAVEVHVNTPDGPLLTRGGPQGSARTEKWVRDEIRFYLVGVDASPAAPPRVLQSLMVRVTDNECPQTGDER